MASKKRISFRPTNDYPSVREDLEKISKRRKPPIPLNHLVEQALIAYIKKNK